MKKVLEKCLKAICFLAIFCIIFIVFQEFLRAKWIVGEDNTATTSAFAEYAELDENTLDVLFVGTSHVYYGIDPMYMYEETGMTSFTFGGPGLRMDLTYLLLEHLLETQNPKVVILDMSAIQFSDQQTEARCHKISDFLPLSRGKIEYAFNNGNEELTPMSVLFPLTRYHSRWETFGSNDVEYMLGTMEQTAVRGHYVTYRQNAPKMRFESPKEDFVFVERTQDYLDRFMKLCEEKGISVVMMKIPSPGWRVNHSEKAFELAQQYDVPFLELYYEMDAMGMDAETDFYDESDHVNQYGAEKVTSYLADYILQNYEMEDHRGKYTKWDEDLEIYHAYKEAVFEDSITGQSSQEE